MRYLIPFIAVTGLAALLAWLTLSKDPDPCADPADPGAAILADDPDDQDALVNRAIIVRAGCEENDESQ